VTDDLHSCPRQPRSEAGSVLASPRSSYHVTWRLVQEGPCPSTGLGELHWGLAEGDTLYVGQRETMFPESLSKRGRDAECPGGPGALAAPLPRAGLSGSPCPSPIPNPAGRRTASGPSKQASLQMAALLLPRSPVLRDGFLECSGLSCILRKNAILCSILRTVPSVTGLCDSISEMHSLIDK
jgi:hypothetical protein